MDLLPHIVSYLEEMIQDRDENPTARGSALKMMKSVTSYEFLVALSIGNRVVGTTNELCLKLQGN